MEHRGWPEPGELVICHVQKVSPFGAYAELEEYGMQEGLIHISEVASGWVKHIRDHVREGQKIVCKVLRIDSRRAHIDLSLKDVNEHQRRQKVQEWKNEQKALKWLSFVEEELKLTPDERKHLDETLYNTFEHFYDVFEEAAFNGATSLGDLNLDSKWIDAILTIATDNVKIPYVDISGYATLTTTASNGVEHIKEALTLASAADVPEVSLEIVYTGAPIYRIHVKAPDYKTAEAVLKESSDKAIKYLETRGGEGQFFRHLAVK